MFFKKTIAIICVTIALGLVSCGETKKDVKKGSPFEQLVSQASDSLSSNPAFTKNLINRSFDVASDSLEYYELKYLVASSCFNLTQYDTTVSVSRDILSFCSRNGKQEVVKLLEARTQNVLANYYNCLFVQDSAFVYYQKALSFFLSIDDHPSIILLYINMADVNIGKGDYANGVKWYRSALLLSDSTENNDAVFSIYSGLGRAYLDLRDFQQSEKYYRSAEVFFSKQALIDQYIYCNNRGNLYYYWNRYEAALPWFQKAYALVSPGHYEFHIQLSGLNLADTYLRLNQLDSASFYAEMGKTYFPSIQHISAAYYNTAIRAGIALKQKRIALSRKLLESISNPTGIDYNLVSIRNKVFMDYCVLTGDYRKAYQSLLENVTLNDSLRANVTLKRAATYDMQYKLDKSLLVRNLHIAKQKVEIESMRFRFTLLGAGGLALILLSLTTFFWLRRKKDLQLLQLKERLSQLRMQNIRNRISPHFIFNVLNGITGEQTSDKRRDLLILLMRKSLEMADEPLVKLDQELEFVRLFVELERYNLGDNFIFECEVDSAISTGNISIPPLFLQIPVENAIKHGLKTLTGEKQLQIRIEKSNIGVRVTIHDNGAGFASGVTNHAGTSTGMKVLQETIAYLNTRNASKVSYKVLTAAETPLAGTTVEIIIPENLLV
jgi:tetratricopeptide (TPR) repeat protein